MNFIATQIVCTNQEPDYEDHDQAHIEEVGIKGEIGTLSLEDVLRKIRLGISFYTKENGERAEVHKYDCDTCGFTTIRTDPDSSEANNLDNLDECI